MSGIAVSKLRSKEEIRDILEGLVRQSSLSISLNRRAKIILLGTMGCSNYSIAKQLSVDVGTVKRWRERWSAAWPMINRFGEPRLGERRRIGKSELLRREIIELLSDNKRSGAPKKFSLSQRKQLVALACEKPDDYGVPISQWSGRALSEIAVRKGIVESISVTQLNWILKKYGRPSAQMPKLDVSQDQGLEKLLQKS